VDFSLSDEQTMIVRSVRAFVEDELYPLEQEIETTGVVRRETAELVKRRCKDLGFFACNMPEVHGGGGLDNFTLTLVERELGRASMALTVFFGRPSGILMACDAAQREDYLLPAIRGERFDALAMTEPEAGSDVRGMRCMAKPDGDDWILNGTKHFISHADIADFVILFAATGEERTTLGARKVITCFLVDRDTPGFEIRRGYNSLSHRGYHNAILEFTDCRVARTQVLGEVGKGFDLANLWLQGTRLTVAASCVGRARRCFDLAVSQAAQRKQFGRPIGANQGVSFKLADMVTRIDAAEYLTLAAAWKLDQGLDAARDIASAKLFASEMLGFVTDETLQIFGGMGLMEDLPIARFWRDARVERIWDGTSEIQRHIISRSLLRPLGA
jgi:acyl-CoA dehydrogenase